MGLMFKNNQITKLKYFPIQDVVWSHTQNSVYVLRTVQDSMENLSLRS